MDHLDEEARYEDEADIVASLPLLGQPEDLSAIPALSEPISHRQSEQSVSDPLRFVLSFVLP